MTKQNSPTVMVIGGSTPTCEAGIQADILTLSHFNVKPLTAISAITAQNINSFKDVNIVDSKLLESQILSGLEFNKPQFIKFGMIGNLKNLQTCEKYMSKYKSIIDPVFQSSTGMELLTQEALQHLKSHTLFNAYIITPNIPEAEILLQKKITTEDQLIKSAIDLFHHYNSIIYLKGGHFNSHFAIDVVISSKESFILKVKKNQKKIIHGSGCKFSSALAANLSKGLNLIESSREAKNYISKIFDSTNNKKNLSIEEIHI